MMRKKGFTLIELLVVIAIIAILAAMLFPVFARARESARKIQCLSNIKNIAIAVNMYLTDYERFPPSEHRAEVVAYFTGRCGCGDGRPCCADRMASANPYLKWPVILEDYTRNRDIWRCPSARMVNGFTINSGWASGANGDWFAEYMANIDTCPTVRPCGGPYPPGWGGTVTDTILQGWDGCAGPDSGGFDQSIGTAPRWALDAKTSIMTDVTKYPVAYDGMPSGADRTSWIAYPDVCRIDSVACREGCGADWVNCSWSTDCGPQIGDPRINLDIEYRKAFGQARHLGGSNIGFADGHAAWFASEAILFGGENWSGFASDADIVRGVGTCFNPTTEEYVWP
jgi:prepilin-type N-terminal cleavage/methylation domain-containing protein/prepilin-type processing-associated H-X9-DG protein